MKSRMVGVALAAVMACAGWAGSGGSAEAAQLYNADFQIYLPFYAPSGEPDIGGTIDLSGSVAGVGIRSNFKLNGLMYSFEDFGSATLLTVSGVYSAYPDSPGDLTATIYFREYAPGQFDLISNQLDYYFTFGSDPTVRHGLDLTNGYGVLNYTLAPSPVPLPAALPLFGLAILTAGVATSLSRRAYHQAARG